MLMMSSRRPEMAYGLAKLRNIGPHRHRQSIFQSCPYFQPSGLHNLRAFRRLYYACPTLGF